MSFEESIPVGAFPADFADRVERHGLGGCDPLAFCAEFEKDNPMATTRFTLEQPDSSLACILNRSRRLTIATQQAAIWMYTDRVTFAHMNEKFGISRAKCSVAQAVVGERKTSARRGRTAASLSVLTRSAGLRLTLASLLSTSLRARVGRVATERLP